MSFFSNTRADNRCPGPITGNPLNGLCERVCIQTNKVFDSCRKQISETGLTFTLTNITPQDLVEPYTFVSAQTNGDAYFSNLVIDRFPDRPNFARVSGTVNVPIIVNFTDSTGKEGSGTTVLSFNQDVILFVPQPSVVPFTIDVFAGLAIADATYLGDNTFSCDACIQIILRVIVNTNILVPSYGYCPIPPCQDYSTNDVCPGFFDLPIYPV